MTFGRQLKTLRAARGLTQKELAELASTSHVFVSHIERGNLLPSPDLKRRLREALRWGIYEDRAFEILECEAEKESA